MSKFQFGCNWFRPYAFAWYENLADRLIDVVGYQVCGIYFYIQK